jgi:ketosteroid isomerase-like protein
MAQSDDPIEVVSAFNAALNLHDVPAVMALMTDDCVFENTFPAPDGERFVGQAAVRGFWENFLAGSPSAHFDLEELFASGDRVVQRWVYTWAGDDGTKGHIRGIDLFTIRDGKVAEKLAYVKG